MSSAQVLSRTDAKVSSTPGFFQQPEALVNDWKIYTTAQLHLGAALETTAWEIHVRS